ncbi:MAG: arylesterase [Pseudomonadota bacterium]
MFALVACSDAPQRSAETEVADSPASNATPERSTPTQNESLDDEATVILVIGDSLSAAYGLDNPADGWVGLLDAQLNAEEPRYRIVNASISGDTTAGGRSRLPAALQRHQPDIVIIELGGNDGLRGIDLSASRGNLRAMLDATLAAGAQPVLFGMKIPPNYGIRYTQDFDAMFVELAEEYDVAFEPFFLMDVALEPMLMQADGIHPNEQAQPKMLARAWPAIEQALAQLIVSQSDTNID